MAVKQRETTHDSNQVDLKRLLDYIEAFHQQGYLPSLPELSKCCTGLLKRLARTQVPRDSDGLAFYLKQLRIAENFLLTVPEHISAEARQQIQLNVLKKLYHIITDPTREPCPTASVVLAALIQDDASIKSSVEFLVKEADTKTQRGDVESVVKTLLTTFYAWLSQWQCIPVLGDWVMALVKTLEEKEMFTVLITVSIDNIERLLEALLSPTAVRQAIAPVVIHLLASLRNFREVLIKIAPRLPLVLESLASDSEQSSRRVLQNLVEITSHMVKHNSRKQEFTYLSVCLDAHINVHISLGILNMKPWERCDPRVTRSATQLLTPARKIGLVNLGNTCYMNSVLQALFHTKAFSNGVIRRMHRFPIFDSLSQLFVMMSFSFRQRLDPSDFFHKIKPPHFTSQDQHDSSEFLSYLLELLHNQELSNEKLRQEEANGSLEKVASPSMDYVQELDRTIFEIAREVQEKFKPGVPLDLDSEAPVVSLMTNDSRNPLATAIDNRGVNLSGEVSESSNLRTHSDAEKMDRLRFGISFDEEEDFEEPSPPKKRCLSPVNLQKNEAASSSSESMRHALQPRTKKPAASDNRGVSMGSEISESTAVRLSSDAEGMDRLRFEGTSNDEHDDYEDPSPTKKRCLSPANQQKNAIASSSKASLCYSVESTSCYDDNANPVDVKDENDVKQEAIEINNDSMKEEGVRESDNDIFLLGGGASRRSKCAGKKRGAPSQKPSSASSQPTPGASQTSSIHQYGDSFVQGLFGGVQLTNITCMFCRAQTVRYDMFRDLQLAIPEKTLQPLVSVQMLIDYYCGTELLIGSNQYQCPSCCHLRDAEKKVSIEVPPRHLILVLKNFRFNSRIKVQTKLLHAVQHSKYVRLPTKSSVLPIYEIYAVIVHSGTSLDSGHYYTYAKDGDKWLKFNDDHVEQSNDFELNALTKTSTPYILFYRRLDEASEEGETPLIDSVPPRLLEMLQAHNKDFMEYVQNYRGPTTRHNASRCTP